MSQFFINDDQEWEDLGGGMRRKIMPWTDELMGVYIRFDQGAVGTRHVHDRHTQIGYIAAGRFEVELDGEKRILGSGDAYLATRNGQHGAVALEDGSVIVDFFTPKRDDFIS
ncbi:MAG: cupin domain-containing protein [Planctomycetes bacterium]|nr:cupin domain-containing protein [Planctomycetota bacterium]